MHLEDQDPGCFSPVAGFVSGKRRGGNILSSDLSGIGIHLALYAMGIRIRSGNALMHGISNTLKGLYLQ